jgi:hypothetical protein
MEEETNVNRILVGEPERKRQLGRQRLGGRALANTVIDLQFQYNFV